jgi:hypothetical protein
MYKRFVRVLAFFIVPLFLFGWVNPSHATSIDYRQLKGEEKFTVIKNEIIDSEQSLSHYRADDAYNIIVRSLSEFQQLRRLLDQSKNPDDVIEKIADGLDTIASSYEDVTKLEKDILKNRRGIFSRLRDVGNETLRTQKQLDNKANSLTSENEKLQRRLNSNMDGISLQEIEVSLKGNESIIKSLKAQSLIWDKFYLKQDQLSEKLGLNGRKIDLLFHILDVNAALLHERRAADEVLC